MSVNALIVRATGFKSIGELITHGFTPGDEGAVSSGDDVQVVIAGTVGATDCYVVHTGGTAVQVVISSSTKVVITIATGTAIRITQ
jgi:hypothetical protein